MSENEVKHSPTPWRVEKNLYGTANIIETDGRQIAACADGVMSFDPAEEEASAKQDEANAAHIVECVNAHERLVEELADANEYIYHLIDQLRNYERMVGLVRRMIPAVDCWRNATNDCEEVRQCDVLMADARNAIGEEAGND